MSVSGIVVHHRGRDLLAPCLASLEKALGRLGEEGELVVVDNGSADGTAAWFADPHRFPGRVLYHRNATNLGFAAGNNVGARVSQGQRLLFLNNDTLVQRGWLSEMLQILDADPKVGIVGIKQLFRWIDPEIVGDVKDVDDEGDVERS